MYKNELIVALKDLAKKDLTDESNIFDHPCSVAVRALDQAYYDIEELRSLAKSGRYCKRHKVLVETPYNPQW